MKLLIWEPIPAHMTSNHWHNCALLGAVLGMVGAAWWLVKQGKLSLPVGDELRPIQFHADWIQVYFEQRRERRWLIGRPVLSKVGCVCGEGKLPQRLLQSTCLAECDA